MPISGNPISTGATGYYATQADTEDEFGTTNIATWSNLDGTPSGTPANTTRVQRALDSSSAVINRFFANSKYVVPLVLGPLSKPVVNKWSVVIAGENLAHNRGQRTAGEAPDAYSIALKQVMDEMLDVRGSAGNMLIDAATKNGSPPFVGGFDPQTNQRVYPTNQGSRWYGNLIGWG